MTYEGSAHRTPAEQAQVVAEHEVWRLRRAGDPNPFPRFTLSRDLGQPVSTTRKAALWAAVLLLCIGLLLAAALVPEPQTDSHTTEREEVIP